MKHVSFEIRHVVEVRMETAEKGLLFQLMDELWDHFLAYLQPWSFGAGGSVCGFVAHLRECGPCHDGLEGVRAAGLILWLAPLAVETAGGGHFGRRYAFLPRPVTLRRVGS